jgi:hypothetical protein
MKQNATRKCKQIYGWHLNRLTRKIKTGSKKNKQFASIGREFSTKNKKGIIKMCLEDSMKSYLYYKDENDYNTKLDKLDGLLKKVKIDLNMTPKQMKDIGKKLEKDILKMLKS